MNRALAAPSLLACAALAACQPSAPPPAAAPQAAAPATVFETMVQTFTPEAGRVWELAGSLYADSGELDASQLTDEQWQQFTAAATRLRDVATALAQAPALRVAPPGVKIQNEGTSGVPGATEVQALLDADPEGFRQEARLAAVVASDAIAAAAARDAARADEASNRLNDVCTGCHTRFWYPEELPPP